MLSTISSFSRIGSSSRPAQPREDTAASQAPGCQAEYSNNGTTAELTQSSSLSFISALSHRITRAPSYSTISSGNHAPSRPNILRLSTDLTSMMPSAVKKYKASADLKTGVYDLRPPIPELSPEPGRSARELKEGRQPQEGQTPLANTSPLQQGQSSIHRKPTHPPETEIFDKPLPRIDCSSPPITAETKDRHSPTSPDFQLPSEEVQRQRRLDKVRRMLGERVPQELIYHGGTERIINVNVFPDPPLTDTLTRREQGDKQPKKSPRLVRGASLTLSSVSGTLLPTGPALGGSQEGRDIAGNANTNLEPGMLAPFVFTKDVTLPRARTFHALGDNKSRPTTANSTLDSHIQHQKDVKKTSVFPRRATVHEPTGRQTSSPTRDPPNKRLDVVEAAPDPQLPPMQFSKPSLRLIGGDEDGVEEDDSSESHTPPLRPRYKPYEESELISGRTNSYSSTSITNSHAPSSRPETPFVDSMLPLKPRLLAPRATVQGGSDPRDAVVRRERRQGWSGEWNREDMQDVIKTLRSLK